MAYQDEWVDDPIQDEWVDDPAPSRNPFASAASGLYSTPNEKPPGGWRGTASDIYRPVLQGVGAGLGAIAGGAVGAPTVAGTIPGALVGGGLGYAAGNQMANIYDEKLGLRKFQGVGRELVGAGEDVVTGAAYEAGGQIAGRLIPPVVAAAGRGLQASGRGIAKSTVKMPTTEKWTKTAHGLEEDMSEAELSTMRNRVADRLLNEKINISGKGAVGAERLRQGAGQAIEDAASTATGKGVRVSPKEIRALTEEAINRMSKKPGGVNPEGTLTEVQSAGEEFLKHAEGKEALGKDFTPSELLAIRKAMYKDIGEGSYGKVAGAKVEAQKAIAAGLTRKLKDAVPELAQLDAAYPEYKNLELAIRRAAARTENWNKLPWPDFAAGIVGGVSAGIPGALGVVALKKVLTNPNVQLALGRALKKVGNKLAGVGATMPKGNAMPGYGGAPTP